MQSLEMEIVLVLTDLVSLTGRASLHKTVVWFHLLLLENSYPKNRRIHQNKEMIMRNELY